MQVRHRMMLGQQVVENVHRARDVCADAGGFFASSAERDVTKPNGFIAILWVGAASLAAGVIALGIGLLIA